MIGVREKWRKWGNKSRRADLCLAHVDQRLFEMLRGSWGMPRGQLAGISKCKWDNVTDWHTNNTTVFFHKTLTALGKMKPVMAQRASYFEKKHIWKEETVKQKGNLTFFFPPLQKAGSQSPSEPHKWRPDESEDISKCTTVTPPPT